MIKNQVAIIGFGFVGKGMQKIFPDAYVYDRENGLKTLGENGTKWEDGITWANREAINRDCGLAIVCVPTPMKFSGDEFPAADTSIVEEVVGWLEAPYILLKSTVPPSTTERLRKETGKKILFSPEFIGEGKYQVTPWRYPDPTNPLTHEFVVIGGPEKERDDVCQYFVNRLGWEKTYYLISSTEAELVKYAINTWLSMQVIWSNEFASLCKKLGASWNRVREGWAMDNRTSKSHTAVFDDEGFSQKCLPKDINALIARADEVGIDLSVLKAVTRKNNKIVK